MSDSSVGHSSGTAPQAGVCIRGEENEATARVLTSDAMAFVAALHRRFEGDRCRLLAARTARQAEFDAGARPAFLDETRAIRESEWRIADAPADLRDRRVEITGPPERKMLINALNSGARVFMADFEDATAPTWANVIDGQSACMDAVRRTLDFMSAEGKRYALNDTTATLVVRPRGWHLREAHLEIDGAPCSASVFDFGLYLFHNATELLARGSGPYFYLPKLESHHEAALWNNVFIAAQEQLGIPRGTIRATVLIETAPAAFEMDEILHALREHASGLNAGRWDYIFSIIKKFGGDPSMVLPDRGLVTMTAPFMRAYAQLLVRTCHRRAAHALGGMAAFVPSRRDAAVNEAAFARVREDKLREAGDGFDGTWVAHPDLVPVAMAVFDARLGDRPNQFDRAGEPTLLDAAALLDVRMPDGHVTDAGARANVNIALQYIEAWLGGAGAVAIHNLMEDTATAEISRAQLWQWLRHGAMLEDSGAPFSHARYEQLRDEELAALHAARGELPSRYRDAAALLDELVLAPGFVEFLTVPGYRYLVATRTQES